MFKPLHSDHAIESVIFRLVGGGEMTEHERVLLDKGYEDCWKAVLPAVNRGQMLEISLAPRPLTDKRPKPLAPTQYVEFLRTGEAAWWMEVAGPTITVGCTRYGGWKSTCGKAYELFNGLGKAIGQNHPLAHIRSAELTYRDLLVWDGPNDNYDPNLAIQTAWIPEKARNSKPWHKGEGWVSTSKDTQILERFQISSELRTEKDQKRPIISVETTAIWGFGATESCIRLDRAFGNIQLVDVTTNTGRFIFNDLHERTHRLFGKLVSPDIADQIGLTKKGDAK